MTATSKNSASHKATQQSAASKESAPKDHTPSVTLSVSDLVVDVPGRRILDNINVEFHGGEVVALVGPNGAGKSTLLGAIAGDRTPSAGSIAINGVDITKTKLIELARQRAVLVQENKLSFPFSVNQVVEMGRSPWHGTEHEDEDDNIIDKAIDIAEVGHLRTRSFQSLSGGEKARVAFARILAQQTDILMLDEPTAALDIKHQEAVLKQARAEALSGKVVVVVLHDLTLAASYSDKVIVISQGVVTAQGTPRDVMTSERLTEVYQYPITVFDHPVTGELIVLPQRGCPPLSTRLPISAKEN